MTLYYPRKLPLVKIPMKLLTWTTAARMGLWKVF